MNRRRKPLPILVVVILIFDVALPSASAHDTYRTSERGRSLVCDTTALAGSVASAQGSATPAAIAPGDMLTNEVAFQEVNDWIEFYVLKAADYEGLRVYYRGGSGVKELPKITASAGAYIVLHFDGDPADDENDATGKGVEWLLGYSYYRFGINRDGQCGENPAGGDGIR